MSILPSISMKMQEILQKEAKASAEENGLIQRRGGKVTGENLAQTLIFGWWQEPEASLDELCGMGAAVGLDISVQGLNQRWNKRTADFLAGLLSRMVSNQVAGEDVDQTVLNRFTHVYLEDSSIVALSDELEEQWRGCGGHGPDSAVKLQTRLELKRGQLDGPHLVDGRVHDRLASEAHPTVEAGALRITDLGFWKLSEWEQARSTESYWLSRLKSSTHFFVKQQEWTAADWCYQLKGDEFEVEILLGKVAQVPVRLIGRRVPAEVSAVRRRKLKRAAQKRGQTLSESRLALADWTLFVTNAPVSLLSADEVFILYRCRWQIELLFKLWKSHGHIDKSRSENAWRQLCELYAKLIAMLLQQWIFSGAIWRFHNRSWVRAARIVRSHVIRLAIAIQQPSSLSDVLFSIRDILSKGCRINKSLKQPRSFQLLLALES